MSIASKLADDLLEIVGANDEKQGITQWLDTGIPELNWALSNNYRRGFPVGRMVEIFGPSSSGKTFLATMAMAAAQKAGGVVGFSDHERTFEPVLAQSLGLKVGGLDDGWIYKRPKTFEESVDKAVHVCEGVRKNGVIPDDAPLVWVFDSVASMVPRSKLFDEKGNRRELGDLKMNDKLALAAATSQAYPLLAQFAEDNNMLVLLLNQIREKPGVLYGDPTTTPGGKAADFYASIRLQIGKSEITNGKKSDEKEIMGFQISAKTIKNKVARMGRKAHWQFRFNEGLGVTVDQIATNVDFLVRKGFIEKDGQRVIWDGKKLFQSQLVTQLRAEPDAHERLMALLPAEPDEHDDGDDVATADE